MNLLKLFFGSLLILGTGSVVLAGPGADRKDLEFDTSSGGFPNSLGGRHFYVSKKQAGTSVARPGFAAGEATCRDYIAKVICLVDATMEGQEPEERPCLAGGETYAIYFEQLFDHQPPALQRMFCSLDHIFIEKQFNATAYAGTRENEAGEIVGAVMGIRRSVLDEQLTLQHWASWKEQLSFGGIIEGYQVKADLPMVLTKSNPGANDFLYFLVAHEFGHIFDFANGLNELECEGEEQEQELEEGQRPNCHFRANSWGAISWKNLDEVKPTFAFYKREGLCFYACGETPLARNVVAKLYHEFSAAGFISLYAATNAWDDFAETLAYLLATKHTGMTYQIHDQQGSSYDIAAKLYSPLLLEKREYLEKFLERKDIVYP